MKHIPLNHGMFAIVDNDDFNYLSKFTWYAKKRIRKNGSPCYYAARTHYINGVCKTVRMHRIILKAEGTDEVDHRDGDGLNNQKSNLRLCSHTQNAQAMHVTGGKSRFKGVSFKKNNGFKDWGANITINGKKKCLGYFRTEEEAAIAYDLAAFRNFRDFAVPNLLPHDPYNRLVMTEECLRVAVEGLENISGTNGGDVTTLSPSSEEIAQHLLCVISTLLS